MRTLIAAVALTISSLVSAHAAGFSSVIPERSTIAFGFRQMGVPMEGQFKRFTAQVSLNSAQIDKAKGRMEIDLASIDTGLPDADKELMGKPWFHVSSYPKATFVLKTISMTTPGNYQASGTLSIKGQTRDISFPFKLSPQGALAGSVVIRRSDYSVGEGAWAKFDVLANEITVNFNLALK